MSSATTALSPTPSPLPTPPHLLDSSTCTRNEPTSTSPPSLAPPISSSSLLSTTRYIDHDPALHNERSKYTSIFNPEPHALATGESLSDGNRPTSSYQSTMNPQPISDGSTSTTFRLSTCSQGLDAAHVNADAGPLGIGVQFHTGQSLATNGDLRTNDQQFAAQQVRFAAQQSNESPVDGVLGVGQYTNGRELGYRGFLPEGMDVREALAKCEDPGLSWSLRFWVTIADPLTQHVFFACPASGQCSWDPPVGAFVVPRSPEGEWWELSDASRKNRSYYYNTLTGKTQWTRPGGDAFVIPFGLIQRSALPPHHDNPGSSSINSERSADMNSTPQRHIPDAPDYTPSPAPAPIVSSHGGVGPQSNPTSPSQRSFRHSLTNGSSSSPTTPTTLRSSNLDETDGGGQGGQSRSIKSESSNRFTSFSLKQPSLPTTPTRQVVAESSTSQRTVERESIASAITPTSVTSPVIGAVEEAGPTYGNGRGGDGEETEKKWWERRRSSAMGKLIPSPLRNGKIKSEGSAEMCEVEVKSVTKNLTYMDEPILLESNIRTKRMSTGLHPLLPSAVNDEIQAFQTEDFAERYFATQRSGMLRQRIPFKRIIEWQRTPISGPILVLTKNLSKDAILTFKIIQHVMGERDKPVDVAKSQLSTSSSLGSSSSINLATALRNGKAKVAAFGIGGGVDGEGNRKNEKMIVLEEIRWMVQLGVLRGEMRDEIYCQLVKQLTKNPDHDAVILGFQLFCVLVAAFAPSKNFETFVKVFLQRSCVQSADGIDIMAKHCLAKIEAMATRGGRSRILTLTEIEHASDAAFYPSVYGQSLETVMHLQEASYPDLKIPIILPFLADGILALGGTSSEGIFRIPGDGDLIADLKTRIDRGHYQLDGIDDPHVAASLFKLWLRELEEPVIPKDMYDDALASSRDPNETVRFVAGLPEHNRRVLLFVISFIQMFLRPEVIQVTKMTAQNIALVLAPNILRTTSNSLSTVFTNSNFESRFILNLLEHLNPGVVDAGYKPTHGSIPVSTFEIDGNGDDGSLIQGADVRQGSQESNVECDATPVDGSAEIGGGQERRKTILEEEAVGVMDKMEV